MSGVLNSSFLNGSATNITHGGGRSFSSSFSAQPRAGPPVFHHTGIQGLHNMRTDFNVPSMVVSLSSRNSAIHGVPSGGMQQSSGNLLAGLFGSNNIQDQLSQISHVVSDGHSGITNRGASPQVLSMLGNSYVSGGNLLSQNHGQAFPSLGSRPNSAGVPQGQIGQLNQEFCIQNEDFPALPGFKGGSVDFGMDFRQKDQLQDNNVSMMQSQHFSMGRSSGFTLGGTYSSHQPQHQQQHMPSVSGSSDSFTSANNQRLLQSHASDMFPSSNSTFHIHVPILKFNEDFPALPGFKGSQGLGGPIGCLPSDSRGVEFDLELYKEWEARSMRMNKIYMCVADVNNLLYIADRFNQSGYTLYSSEETLKILEDNGINAYVPHGIEKFNKKVHQTDLSREIRNAFVDLEFWKFNILVMNGMTSRVAICLCVGALLNNKVVVVDPADYKLVSDLVLSHYGLSSQAKKYLRTKALDVIKKLTDLI